MKLYDENAFHYVFRVGIRERTRRVYLVEFDVITIERRLFPGSHSLQSKSFDISLRHQHTAVLFIWISSLSAPFCLSRFPLAWLRYKVQYRLIIFPPGASSSSCSLKLKKIAFCVSHIVSYRWLVGPVPAAVDCVDRSYSNSRILPPAGCGCCLSNAAQQEEEAILLTSCTHLTGLVLLFLLLLLLLARSFLFHKERVVDVSLARYCSGLLHWIRRRVFSSSSSISLDPPPSPQCCASVKMTSFPGKMQLLQLLRLPSGGLKYCSSPVYCTLRKF